MLINVTPQQVLAANESPKRAVARAIATAIPSKRIAVYYNKIEVGPPQGFITLTNTPELYEWIWGLGETEININLDFTNLQASIA